MNLNIINSGAYLRTAREFPYDAQKLNQQINKSWVDIANSVNIRVVGTCPTNGVAVTGEEWFISGNQKQQSLRRIYTFTEAGSIPHEIFSNIFMVSPRSYGSYIGTDGNYYGVIFASTTTSVADLTTFYVTPSISMTSGDIVIIQGSGAVAISSGIINLEWISAI